MKNLMLALSLVLVAWSSHSISGTEKKFELVELNKVLVPAEGFDDNDNIEVVLDGVLPNACFELDQTLFRLDRKKKIIYLQQKAYVKNIPACESGELTDELSWKVPFSQTLTLGHLDRGEYTLSFLGKTGSVQTRTFKVGAASSGTSVDEALYAPVSGAFIPELIFETPNAEAILTGILSSTCMSVSEEMVEVKKVGDVIIVLPKLQVLKSDDCRDTQTPLQLMIPLGPLTKGRYLLHIRSMSGRAVNKTFTVIEQETNIGGRL